MSMLTSMECDGREEVFGSMGGLGERGGAVRAIVVVRGWQMLV